MARIGATGVTGAEWFGDAGARAVIAVLLVLARTAADLAVLWLPLWAPGRLT